MHADEVVMFVLDPEDISTDLDVTPWDAAGGSFVGALPDRSEDGELTASLAALERACEAFDSVDVSAHAAEVALRKRVGSRAMLCAAYFDVRSYVASDEHRELLAPAGLLGPYLSGVRMWTTDVIDAMRELAHQLNVLEPQWSAFRERLGAIAWLHERAKGEEGRVLRVADALPEDIREAVDDLCVAFTSFKHRLDEPMG